MLVRPNPQLILICLISCIIFTLSCTNNAETEDKYADYNIPLFDGKYATGYVIATPKFGSYGMLELHQGKAHSESYIALYDKNDLGSLAIGDKYYVRVNTFEGLPKIVEATQNLDSSDNLFTGTPITNIDYHSISDHGGDAPWHRNGHRINNGYTVGTDNISRLKIKTEDGSEATFIVPTHLIDMAIALANVTVNDVVYYELNSAGTTYTKLDSVHRHGHIVYD